MHILKMGFLGPLLISLILLVWEGMGLEEQGLLSHCPRWFIFLGDRARQTGNQATP